MSVLMMEKKCGPTCLSDIQFCIDCNDLVFVQWFIVDGF